MKVGHNSLLIQGCAKVEALEARLTSKSYYPSLHERLIRSWIVAVHPVVNQHSVCLSAFGSSQPLCIS